MVLRRVRSAADFLKGTLHEVGHTMGLGHAPSPQTAGKSVMNGRSGINDVNNLTPTDVQECDKQSVKPESSVPNPYTVTIALAFTDSNAANGVDTNQPKRYLADR